MTGSSHAASVARLGDPDTALSVRSIALASLARCAAGLGGSKDPGLAFLGRQPEPSEEMVQELLAGRLRAAEEAPLHALAAALRLSSVELLTLALLQAVDEEPLVAQAVAALQAPAHGSRPTLGLLSVAFCDYAAGRSVIELLAGGPAARCGVLEFEEGDCALPERGVFLSTPLFLALRGIDGPFPHVSVGASDGVSVVPLGPGIEATLVQHALALGLHGGALCIRSSSPSEGRAAAEVISRTLDRRAAFVELDGVLPGLGAFLTLRDLMPAFCLRLGPGERRLLPGVPGYSGPHLVLLGLDGAVESAQGVVPEVSMSVPGVDERTLLWTLSLGDPMLARQLAVRHRHGPGRIAHLGRLARHHALLEQAPGVAEHHVEAAAWTIEGGGLGSLARPLRDRVPDEAFVASNHLRQELEQLVLRCRLREEFSGRLGPTLRDRTPPGVRALLVGPSGTGKTLAASWLACRLGVPLYLIDLAAVTSKYIGETEKNLAEVLARAEDADVVLLFDEADSLFGRRTEIRDSNDRYANAQTNYLLQRIERYDGIVLLTSNSRSRFDTGFSRRLDAIIEFSLPGPEERRALWRSHLGDGHTLSSEQLNRLAATAALAGGHIRNVVLTAAVLASSEGRALGYEDVLDGLSSEYRKLGQSLPTELCGPKERCDSSAAERN